MKLTSFLPHTVLVIRFKIYNFNSKKCPSFHLLSPQDRENWKSSGKIKIKNNKESDASQCGEQQDFVFLNAITLMNVKKLLTALSVEFFC